jgi:hypothetical protein
VDDSLQPKPANEPPIVELGAVFSRIAVKIIEQQEAVIGPIAIEQAQQVTGINVDWASRSISFIIDPAAAINNLVEQYKVLFGQISVEVCKEAASQLIQQLPPGQLPESLK